MEELSDYMEYLREKELSETTRRLYEKQAGIFPEYIGKRRLTKETVLS